MQHDKVIKFNIGGKIFEITKTTIGQYSNSIFAKILEYDNPLKDDRGNLFIDRNPDLAKPIFAFMRDGHWRVDEDLLAMVQQECEYYNTPKPEEEPFTYERIRNITKNAVWEKTKRKIIETAQEAHSGYRPDYTLTPECQETLTKLGFTIQNGCIYWAEQVPPPNSDYIVFARQGFTQT